jgi:ketosteroid isomerase-like protein
MTILRAIALAAGLAFIAACGNGAGEDAAAPAATAPAPAPVPAAAGEALVEAEVRAMIEAVEAASARNDVDGQATHFAEDIAMVTMSPRPDGSMATETRTKTQFVAQELASQAATPGSRYRSTITKITVNGGSADAHVSSEIDATMDGRATHMTADQVMTVQRRDDRLMIVAVRTTLTGMTIDGNKIF